MALPATRIEDIARDLAETVAVSNSAIRPVPTLFATSPIALGAAGRLGLAGAALVLVWMALAWSMA